MQITLWHHTAHRSTSRSVSSVVIQEGTTKFTMMKKPDQELRPFHPSILAIGVCTEISPRVGMPEWNRESWGYHSDDGKLFTETDSVQEYGPTHQAGDVIGCGGDTQGKNIFFTKNGLNLGKH